MTGIISVDLLCVVLDEKSVQDSNYIIKMRGLVTAALFHKGELSQRMTYRLGYDLAPPPKPEVKATSVTYVASSLNSKAKAQAKQ